MLTHISHEDGIEKEQAEILFSTSFNYMFPDAARSRLCLLPQTETTLSGLRDLGLAMADVGTGDPSDTALDSTMPAIMTYLGQFIDHDITARTDREGTVSTIGRGEPVSPRDPDLVVKELKNGRRPQLDLDSVFGEGPALVAAIKYRSAAKDVPGGKSDSEVLYDNNLKLKIFAAGTRFDLCRGPITDTGKKLPPPAQIADMRNDENLNISQLQMAFLRFYNAVHDAQSGSREEKHTRARQLTRWAYQHIVVNEYLTTVCDKNIVRDTMANGPRFFGASAGRADAFMPLEFSTAAFRFGHSMIRPLYKLNTSPALKLMDILGTNGNPLNFASDGQLDASRIIDWTNYVGPTAQRARKIDTVIGKALGTLPFRPGDPVLTSLARSNLFRACSLSIPTGQAVCDAMGLKPLSASEITTDEDPNIAAVVKASYFDYRTPLWYYILREAAVQQNGESLGEVGSRIVSETLIGLLKQDANSYLNNKMDAAVLGDGIVVNPVTGDKVNTLTTFLKFAGFAL